MSDAAEVLARRRADDLDRTLTRAALDAADAMVVITDTAGIIRYVNRAFTDTTGYRYDEVVGGTPRVLSSGQHDQSFYERLWGTVLDGKVWEGEIINRRKGGELYTDRMTISPVRGGDGDVTHLIAVKRDVSARVNDLLSASPYGVLHLGADASLVYANERACDLLGAPFELLLGHGWRTRIDAGEADALAAAVARTSRSGVVAEPDQVRLLTMGERHVRLHLGALRPGQDTVLGCVLALEDVTAEVAATAALADRELFARTVLDAIESPTAVVDESGVIVHTNPAWRNGPPGDPVLGAAPGTCLLTLPDRRPTPDPASGGGAVDDSAARIVAAVREAVTIAGAKPRIVEHGTGGPRPRWWHIRVSHLPVHAGGAVITASDVTAIRQEQERAAVDAQTDALTGLRNRRGLHAGLEELTDVRDAPISVLFLDLDGFKAVNDAFGHNAGDEVLREVAQRLRTTLRDSDTAARLSGDEFVVLVPDLRRQADALEVAQALLGALSRPYDLRAGTVTLTVSIGVSVFPDDAREAVTLQQHADTAMYRAKHGGKGRIELYAPPRP